MYGIIYRATNKINGKVYIGQTVRSLAERIYYHYYRADNELEITKTHFINAIRKYGKDNFEWEEIDSAENQAELNEKEQYWIEFYNSVENGYNIQAGGHNQNTEKFALACGSIPFFAYRVNGEFLGEFLSQRAFCREFNLNDAHISKLLNNEYNSCNGIIAIKKDLFSQELLQEKLSKAKQSFRLFKAKNLQTNEEFGPFESIKECREILQLKNNHIGEVLKGKRKSQEGYTFYFIDIID